MPLQQVHPADLSAWLASTGATQATLLDVREHWELQTASVAGRIPQGFTFVHVPMQQLPQALQQFEPDAPLAVLCHHAGRSMDCAAWLQSKGFEQLANVAGGIDAWARDHDASIPRY